METLTDRNLFFCSLAIINKRLGKKVYNLSLMCLSFPPHPINLKAGEAVGYMYQQERMPESFHVSTSYCAADYFSILLHPHKIQRSHCI